MKSKNNLFVYFLICIVSILLGGKFLYTSMLSNGSNQYNFVLTLIASLPIILGLYAAWIGSKDDL